MDTKKRLFFICLLTLILFVLGVVVLVAFKYCLFATWIPTKIVTNYGVCLSELNGVLERVLEPFPDVLERYKKSKNV